MFFSNNGGQTWNVGVGPSGINADYIKTGTLDAGNIRIVDNNYVYFLWDKGGITAYREPGQGINFGDDYARFNKYGLSLVEDGNTRLRVGYKYTPNEDGTGKKEHKPIGFYLYNKAGNEIFSTTSANESNNSTARLSLTGEMYVTSTLKEDAYTEYTYSDCYGFSSVELVYKKGDVITGIETEIETTTNIYLIDTLTNNVIVTKLWR